MVRDALDLASASVKAVTTSRGLFILRSTGEIGLVMAEVMAPVILAFRFGSIAGWSGAEVAMLIGLSRAGQGFAYLLGRGLDPANVSQTVRDGSFDQVLVRPVSPLIWMMTSDIQLRYVFRGLTGVAIVAVAGNGADLSWTVPIVALLVLAATACGTMLLAINVLGASLTLITSEGSEITNLLGDGGLGLISFPLDLYGSPLRFVFTFVIPVGLCIYVPLLVVLGRDGPGVLGAGLLWALPAVLGGFVAASSLAWRFAHLLPEHRFMIVVDHLSKTYKGRARTVEAVSDVSFHIEPGEFVGLVGPNGAGKSTTIKMMCGVLVPSAGTVTIDGLVPWTDRRTLTRRMGVVFGQRSQLWWDLLLRDSFRLVSRLYRVPAADMAERMAELDDLLGLGELLEQPVRSLSLGQRMRAELAAAVLPRPKVLFLDEPTIGLDVEAKAAVRTFLAELNQRHGTTVLLTTHDLGDIEQLCNRLMIIDHGRVIYDGSVDGLRDAYATTRVVIVDVRDEAAPDIPEATLRRSEGRRHWLEFPRAEGVTARVIAALLQGHDVVDLMLEEPEIEDIVRQIYREGRVRE